MSIVSRNNIEPQHDLEGLPRHLALTATSKTYQMRVSDTVMVVTTTTGAVDTAIITLPSLAEAVGKLFYVCALFSGTNALSIYEKETGAIYAGDNDDGTLDATDDHVILFSDGIKWRTVLDGVAAS